MFQRPLTKLARGLDRRGIPSMLIDGQAVLLYGEPRLTRDVDVTLGVGPELLPTVLEFAEEAGWRVLTGSPADLVARTLVLPCSEPSSGIRIDLIFPSHPMSGGPSRAPGRWMSAAPRCGTRPWKTW
jgi:hypothetical protein